jgi:hypothetical protein
VTIVDLAHAVVVLANERVRVMRRPKKVHVVLDVARIDILLEDNNVRVVDRSIWVCLNKKRSHRFLTEVTVARL